MLEIWRKPERPGPADPQLLKAVGEYIDAHFEEIEPEEDACIVSASNSILLDEASIDEAPEESLVSFQKIVTLDSLKAKHAKFAKAESAPAAMPAYSGAAPQELDKFLRQTDAGFSETLLKLIDRTGEKDSAVYKRANVDRKLFSKIRSNPDYRPSKSTALAFALALRLDLDETNELIGRAGYVLSHSSKADLIAEYFIVHEDYDIGKLNEVLFAYDLPLIGGAA